ncbi:hypothetical protein [Streptomyces sp. GS7]|uniref:hypothetical protein n=1 Tax=Streptomyces sp. GS7 TaxID=2692234 RepID=UPI001318F46D|nr:hypothetical protein [Streptomyces sp. GS7]QHC23935.1 hypothetical protein GR130_23770 [Streptomyces sp. GS7]
MSEEKRDSADRDGLGGGPWWAGLGPVGGAVLIVAGLALALFFFLFLGRSGSEQHLRVLLGAGKIVAIGLVLVGTALIARRRGTHETDADGNPPGGDDGTG